MDVNEKIARWCGFRPHGDSWRRPNGLVAYILPDFTHSIEACEKWAFPKIVEIDFSYYYYNKTFLKNIECWIYPSDSISFVGRADSLSGAFCNALVKLIELEAEVKEK